MIEIEVHNLSCILTSALPHVLAKVEEWFKIQAPNYWFNARVKAGVWDGYYRFYNRTTHKLPTGLLPTLLRKLLAEDLLFKLKDMRPVMIQKPKLHTLKATNLSSVTLHPHQNAAVYKLLGNQLGNLWFPRGICWLPTGTGKTEIIAAICHHLSAKTLVLVHKKDLLHQTAARLSSRLSTIVGKVGDNHSTTGPQIVVATVQTLAKHLEYYSPLLRNTNVFISDECHRLPARTFQNVAKACPAFVRLAFSATPFDKNDRVQRAKLLSVTGDVLYHETTSKMVNRGVVAPVQMHIIPLTLQHDADWDMPYATVGETIGAYDKFIVHNAQRNELIVKWITERQGPTLVIVSRLAHGSLLSELLFQATGQKVPFLNGDENAKFRQKIFEQLDAGDVRIVIATIADEGVDVPSITNLVLAAGGRSEIRFLQRIGRGMRKKDEGAQCRVLDFLDGTNNFLFAHSKERIQTAEKAGHKIYVERGINTDILPGNGNNSA